MKYGTKMQNGNVLNVAEPDFQKTYFSGRKCRKYAGKTGFLAFSRDFIIGYFFAQTGILGMLNMAESDC
jgi:hypothetical protein